MVQNLIDPETRGKSFSLISTSTWPFCVFPGQSEMKKQYPVELKFTDSIHYSNFIQ